METFLRAKGPYVALIVIDMTVQQYRPDGSPLIPKWKGIEDIMKLAKVLPKERVMDCRLWMTDEDNSSLHELYPEVGLANTKGAELCPELKDLKHISTFVKKVQYSSFFGSTLHSKLQEQNVGVVMLTGINTDYCVFATALDAFYLGYEVWLIQDCCTSFGGSSSHRQGITEFNRYLASKGKVMDASQALKEIKLRNPE